MTDLDAAGYLRELQQYSREGTLITPQNQGVDTIWSCAIEHALRALEDRTGALQYQRNRNGSFTACPI